jgi:hypothetical protein
MALHADSAHDLLDLDIGTLRTFVELFPNEGLSKVVTGYLSSGISRYPLTAEGDSREGPDLSEGGVALTQDVPVSQEDCLVLMTVRRDSWRQTDFTLSAEHTNKSKGRYLRSRKVPVSTLLVG